MRRVLIVVSSYSPAVAADMHRARLLCQQLPEQGWEVEILTPDENYQIPHSIEPDSAAFFDQRTIVHRVHAWKPGLFRAAGMRTIGWRALWPMYRAGAELLRTGRFDLVYFSTTSFILFFLGRLWRARFHVPYILDFHDPWYRSERKYVTTHSRFKGQLAHLLAKYFERFAVRDADGLVAVSPRFLDDLVFRYQASKMPWLDVNRRAVIPFAACRIDLDIVNKSQPRRPAEWADGLLHIAYVGAGGAIMGESMRTLCIGLQQLRKSDPQLVNQVRIHLYGTQTGWQPGRPGQLWEVAESCGVGDLVDEQSARQSYRRATELAACADGLLILGVDDAGYIPSKLFLYLLTGKPVIACFHADSPAIPLFEEEPSLGCLLRFGGSGAMQTSESSMVIRKFLKAMAAGTVTDRDVILAPHLAEAMAAQHADLFERCIQSTRRDRIGI